MRGLESVKIRTILATLEGYCLLTRTGLGESIGIEPTTHRLQVDCSTSELTSWGLIQESNL